MFKFTKSFRWIYHAMANNESFKGNVPNSQNYLSNEWWWYFFRYFERNVPCNLPLQFGWPLPGRLLRLFKTRPTGIFREKPRKLPSQIVIEASLPKTTDTKILS